MSDHAADPRPRLCIVQRTPSENVHSMYHSGHTSFAASQHSLSSRASDMVVLRCGRNSCVEQTYPRSALQQPQAI
ncbi:hypothetical protein A0H81_14848 [Grifola frondosa]|uniref:Uncharacterized protein n=1 Tax=Grifola frondosa TaxID=5627 RepID=A0A1C7LK74_GRIFR|nr:hypothetical protein A0H81_14848 [Grifola frondosa]